MEKLFRKNLNKLHCATGYWLPRSLFKFFLKLLDQWCWRFSEGYMNNFSTELSSQIFDCCPRNFLIQEERIGNVVSTSHWIRPVLKLIHAWLLYPLVLPYNRCEKKHVLLQSTPISVRQYIELMLFCSRNILDLCKVSLGMPWQGTRFIVFQ